MHICYLCNVIFCVSKKLCALCKLRCVNCPCSLCNVHCSVFSAVFGVHLCYLHPAAPHVRHSPVTPGAANDPAEAFAGEPRWPPHPRFVQSTLFQPLPPNFRAGTNLLEIKSKLIQCTMTWPHLTHLADDQTAPQHMATKSAQLCPGICFFCLPGPMLCTKPKPSLMVFFFHIPTFDTGQ